MLLNPQPTEIPDDDNDHCCCHPVPPPPPPPSRPDCPPIGGGDSDDEGEEIFYGGNVYKGITNVGNQPTVNGENSVVETHIIDFNGDLYGEFLIVHFVSFIRDIVKFSSVEELKAQLEKDLKSVK